MSLKNTILGAIALVSISCAQTPNKDAHKHHHHKTVCKDGNCESKVQDCEMKKCSMGKCAMYEEKCALSVSKGKFDVAGDTKFKLVHDGHNYYFSSQEKLEKFKSNLAKNIQEADKRWGKFKWIERR